MIGFTKGRITVSKKIRSSPDRLWRIITDTALWPVWGPSVSSVDCKSKYISHGSSGVVKTVIGLRVPFTITSYCPPTSWSWRVGGIEATGHQIEVMNDGRCNLTFDMPWWAFPYSFICLLALQRIARISDSAISM